MSQRAGMLLVATLLGPCGCDRGAFEGPPSLNAGRTPEVHRAAAAAPDSPDARAAEQARMRDSAESPGRTATGARVGQSTSTHTGVPDANGPADPASSAGDDQVLVGEERERDPGSNTVRIKVLGAEKRQAHVFWGRKDFGVAPLEIERPRNSGPLDLVVIAPGYLPYHARAFTDRDDIISVRLYSAAEAPQLLGYRASEVPAPPGPVPKLVPGSARKPVPSPARSPAQDTKQGSKQGP